MLEPATLLTDSAVKKERLFIDTSTIDPMTSAGVAQLAHSTGQGKFIDAPMSGGVVGAAAGTLTFMIGAAPEAVDGATKVLSMMGRKVLHLGEQGAGLKGKLANNYLLALNNIATAEAMSVDRRENTCPTPYKTPAPPRPHTQPILPHCRLNHSSIEHHHHACANEAMRQHFRLTSFAIYRQPSKVPSASPARASR